MPNSSQTGHTTTPDEVFAESSDVTEDRSRMSFLEHLDELRKRIIYSLYAVGGACVITFYFWKEMYVYLTAYFQHNGGTLIYTRPAGGFMFSMKISFVAAAFLASPFIFAQVWAFIAPGLYKREKRVVLPFVASASILFAAGAAFGHLIAYPAMWKFFNSFAINGVQFFPTIDETFSFYWKMLAGLGAAFEMPVLVYFLAHFGIVTWQFLLRNFKYAILIIFIIAAVLTPSPDPVNQTIFALPMIGLYVLSIGVAWMFGKKRPTASEGR